MGSGTWDRDVFRSYSGMKGMSVSCDTGTIEGDYSSQDMFKQRGVHADLNPKNIVRECCDTAEHPNTIPVILALDVTGSMGSAAVEVAKQLNVIMTKLYDEVKDIEFCVMGIGDLMCDTAPIQMSQFESDIRIAEHMDKVFFEYGGGGNNFESYTAAWYMGARHTKLDCWKRGKKGIIITIGDELINPYLPKKGRYCGLVDATGDNLQDNIETEDLYQEVKDKYDVYHIDVLHNRFSSYGGRSQSFANVIGEDHVFETRIDGISDTIINIIKGHATVEKVETATVKTDDNGAIVW